MQTIVFRPLDWADLPPLQRWLSEPHVEAWWHEALDLDGVRAKYGPRIDGTESTHVYIIEYAKRPIGWIQWYRWSDYPEHAAHLGAGPTTAGVDLALGEADYLGRGLGSRSLRAFVADVVFADPTMTACISDPDERNVRSLRAFEKAGFVVVRSARIPGEEADRRVVCLDRR